MIVNMIGGTALNFNIIGGTTEPSPSDNLIWVNTETEVTGWAISNEEPEAKEGLVWIKVGSSSNVKFSILKDKTCMVYPVGCYQYEGQWEAKIAKTYQNGWVEWVIIAFQDGDQNTDVTGGWSDCINNYGEYGWSTGDYYLASAEYGGGVDISDTIDIGIHAHAGLYNGAAFAGTISAIDLTDRNKVKVNYSFTLHPDRAKEPVARVAVCSSLAIINGTTWMAEAYEDIPSGSGTVELDVSQLSGAFHIVIGGTTVYDSNTTGLYGGDLVVTSVIVE